MNSFNELYFSNGKLEPVATNETYESGDVVCSKSIYL